MGWQALNAAPSPPAMIKSVPPPAPTRPPLAGAAHPTHLLPGPARRRVHGHRDSRLDHILRHGPAHQPEADEADLFHLSLLLGSTDGTDDRICEPDLRSLCILQ